MTKSILLFAETNWLGRTRGTWFPPTTANWSDSRWMKTDFCVFAIHDDSTNSRKKVKLSPFQEQSNLANHDMSHESNYDEKMIIDLETEMMNKNAYDSSMIMHSQANNPVIAVTGRPRSLQELTFRKSRYWVACIFSICCIIFLENE